MRRKEMNYDMLWCLMLLFLGTISLSEGYNNNYEKQPYYYYRGRPMFLGSSSAHQMVSSVILPIYGNVYPRG